MKILLCTMAIFCQGVFAQIPHSSEILLGDTTSHLFINDFFVDENGTLYSTGQHVKKNISLYVAAVNSQQQKITEQFRQYGFDEEGYFIRPYDASHLIVCGHSEDTTGTFNIRLIKMTRAGAVVWDTTYGNDGKGSMEVPFDLAVDSKGNIVVAGVSSSTEVKYLLVKFSTDGKFLWANADKPLGVGSFLLKDIVIDAHDAIYGVTNNAFVSDTAFGTVLKWDSSGTFQWQRHRSVTFFNEHPSNLFLLGDTLYVPGARAAAAENSVAVTVMVVANNGEVLNEIVLPAYSSLQRFTAFSPVFHDRLALIAESFVNTHYFLHTWILSRSLEPIAHDSLMSDAPVAGAVVNNGHEVFDLVRYGAVLSTVAYRRTGGGTVTASEPVHYAVGGRFIDRIDYRPGALYAKSHHSSSAWDRVSIVRFSVPTLSVGRRIVSLPDEIEVLPAYPNPFNPVTNISVALPSAAALSVTITDILGREVETLHTGAMEAGTHVLQWNAARYSGGVYFCRLTSGRWQATQKIVLLK